MTKKDTYTFDYPAILKFEQAQMDNYWMPGEPKVEKDIHSILTECSDEEKHGIITVLRLFTLYELVVGNEYWLGRFRRMFPRPDFNRMAAIFGMTEINIHAPFYNKINELLGLANDEFYSSYVKDDILKSRMDYIDNIVAKKGDIYDDLLSLAVFSMVEGAVLYSSFAYLKSYQVNGKNKLGAIVAGIDFSVRDEHQHSLGGATSFLIAIEEMKQDGTLDPERYAQLVKDIRDAAIYLGHHEERIVDMIFEVGDKDNMKDSMKQFVRSRLNLCLQNVNVPSVYSYDEIGANPVAAWFYQNLNLPVLHDFFVNLGSQYNRDYSESAFKSKNKYTLAI